MTISWKSIILIIGFATPFPDVNLWGTTLKEQNDRFNPLVNINI